MDIINVTITENTENVNINVSETVDNITISEIFPQGPMGPQGPGGANVEQILVAKEFLPAFSVVTDTGYVANSTSTIHRNIIMGVSIADIQSGHAGIVVMAGRIVNALWNWLPGDILYLNGTSISTICPISGFRVIIGQALDQTTVKIEISESILF